MIYFLRFQNGVIKVGYTTQFNKRLSQIRRGSPVANVEVIGTMPGDRELEQSILDELKPYQTHDEFFEDRPEVLIRIEKYLGLEINSLKGCLVTPLKTGGVPPQDDFEDVT